METRHISSRMIPPVVMSQPFKFAFGDDEGVEEDDTSEGNESRNVANADTSPPGPAPCLHTLNDLVRRYHVASLC